MLKKVRVWLAVIMFGGMLWLFTNSGTNIYGLSCLAKLQIIPALLSFNLFVLGLWLVVTLLGGRLYCSSICPLGIMQEIFSYLGAKFRSQPKFSFRSPKNKINNGRYICISIYAIALVGGLSYIVSFLDPYAIFGRLAANFFNPISIWIDNKIAAQLASTSISSTTQVQYFTIDWLNFAISCLWGMIIVIMAFFSGRLYCNIICPVGTALGFISCYSLYQVKIDQQKCVKCGICARNCQAECIDIRHGDVDNSRCIKCFNCLDICHKGAISFSSKPIIFQMSSENDQVEK